MYIYYVTIKRKIYSAKKDNCRKIGLLKRRDIMILYQYSTRGNLAGVLIESSTVTSFYIGKYASIKIKNV